MPIISGGGGGGGGGTVTSVTAADTSVVVGGTAAAPTVRTATLDVIASAHAPAADWSNNAKKITALAAASAATDAASLANTLDQFAAPAANVAWNAKKITGLANGSSAQDAAAFGQIPTLLTAGAALAAPVTIVNSNTYYDGPSASFAAGTWFVWWQMQFDVIVATVQSYEFTGRLWDGTTTYSEAQQDSVPSADTTGFAFAVCGVALITLGSTTTLKLSGACIRAFSASRIASDPTQNSSGSHVATQLRGLRVA